MDELGLNEHHHLQVLNFIRFCRTKRITRLRGVEHCFQDLKESRLYDDTYTIDEVNEILDGLLSAVHGEMESELLNSSHSSVLLLLQLLTQAEKWHLKLNCDVSSLENRELLEQIAVFEERELSSIGNDLNKLRLNPINETGGAELLQNEIDRLKSENERLAKNSQDVEKRMARNLTDKLALELKLKEIEGKPAEIIGPTEEEVNAKIQLIKDEFRKEKETSDALNETLSTNLTSAKHELLQVQEQLDLASKELEKKFQGTAAYRNLKDMLSKKNGLIKDLRKQLAKYDNDNDDDDDEE